MAKNEEKKNYSFPLKDFLGTEIFDIDE